jgi:hypothetical protein
LKNDESLMELVARGAHDRCPGRRNIPFESSSGSEHMRALIILSLIALVFGSGVAEAGMTTAPREMSASAHNAPTDDHATVSRHRRGHVHHARRGIGGPIAAIGGAIGGLFHR